MLNRPKPKPTDWVRCAALTCATVAQFAASIASAQTTIRDSAGIRIIESRHTLTRLAFQAKSIPTIVLGGLHEDPRYEFRTSSNVYLARRMPNQQIVVADGPEIKVFSPSGTLVRVVGRQGSGPGEFRRIDGLCKLRGDTIAVVDGTLRRLTVLTLDGRILRSFRFSGFAVGSPCLEDGTLVVNSGTIGKENSSTGNVPIAVEI